MLDFIYQNDFNSRAIDVYKNKIQQEWTFQGENFVYDLDEVYETDENSVDESSYVTHTNNLNIN